jgi:hypothetical protein
MGLHDPPTPVTSDKIYYVNSYTCNNLCGHDAVACAATAVVDNPVPPFYHATS